MYGFVINGIVPPKRAKIISLRKFTSLGFLLCKSHNKPICYCICLEKEKEENKNARK